MEIDKNEKQWRAIYVRSRAEKKVHEALQARGIESFLPLQMKMRQWSDRKKLVEMPAISGYLFVNISVKEREIVYTTNNVVAFVRYQGNDAIIPQAQLEMMKKALNQTDTPVTLEVGSLPKGKKVTITEGVFAGQSAIVNESRGKKKIALQIEQTGMLITLEADKDVIVYKK